MSDWFTDDRGRIASLDVGEEANRTKDREGETVTGSESFLDDRDQSGDAGEDTEQFSLFSEMDSIDDQLSLTGGEATTESEGFFDGLLGGSDDSTLEESSSGSVRSPIEVNVGSRAAANTIRDEYEDHLDDRDSRREMTVKFLPSTPNAVVNQAQIMREEMGAERSRSQTVSLTSQERGKIKQANGFGQSVTTANWRSAKGVFAREGLSDQFRDAIGSVADFDDPIEGAEAYVSQHKQSGIGNAGRMDAGETDIKNRQRAGRSAATEASNIESHAISGAKKGNQEAIDALVLEAGWDRADAEALAGRVEDPADTMTQEDFEKIVEVEVVRARSNGRFVAEEPQQTGLGSFRSPTNGRFVGDSFTDPGIGRNTENGRFTDGRGDF